MGVCEKDDEDENNVYICKRIRNTLVNTDPVPENTRRSLSHMKIMKIYRELKCENLGNIENSDLYFKNWPKTRLRSSACLPLLYSVGKRYIKLYKAFPAGFKIIPVPQNLHDISTPARQEKFEKEENKTRMTCKFHMCRKRQCQRKEKCFIRESL